MNAVDFARGLLETSDLGPLYTMIYAAEMDRDLLAKYIFAYTCFYDNGTCCRICSAKDYWKEMCLAAASREYPRGGDRRHFRGNAATTAVEKYRAMKKTPMQILTDLCKGVNRLPDLIKRCRTLSQYGPTISYKLADMLERFGFVSLDFQESDFLLISNDPLEGADDICRSYGGEYPIGAHRFLKDEFRDYPAPPGYERPLDVLETETICCKWAHYLRGSYKIGDGTRHQRAGLLRFPELPLSQRLLRAGEEAGLWENEKTPN